MEGAEAKRSDSQPSQPLAERAVECKRRRAILLRANREQHLHPVGSDPPSSEREHERRRWVDPLHVVNGEKHWTLSGQPPERREESRRHRAAVERRPFRIGTKQRYFERAALRPRQLVHNLIECGFEQIAERGKRKLRLRGRGRRREDAEAAGRGPLDAAAPECRLPDSRLALQQQPSSRSVEELSNCRQLLVTPNGLEGLDHHAPIVLATYACVLRDTAWETI
jgi:hypothetical protein